MVTVGVANVLFIADLRGLQSYGEIRRINIRSGVYIWPIYTHINKALNDRNYIGLGLDLTRNSLRPWEIKRETRLSKIECS